MSNAQLAPAGLSIEINGVVLRDLRRAKGITQLDLAARAQIAGPYVSQLETGARKRVGRDVFGRICAALEAKPAQRRKMLEVA